MNDQDTFLEQIWSAILSREKSEIDRAYLSLDETSREVVMKHLQKMTSEEGWHSEQVKSAHKALQVIKKMGST